MKHQRERLRFAVLQALEEQLARPLGIPEIAIASRHGGRGALPPSYRFALRRVTRLRALRGSGGTPERHAYDDISSSANREESMDLYFKSLSSPTPPPRT